MYTAHIKLATADPIAKICVIDARDCSNTFNSDLSVSSDSSSGTVKIASCGSPTDCHGVPTE